MSILKLRAPVMPGALCLWGCHGAQHPLEQLDLPAWGQDAALGAKDHRAHSRTGLEAGPCHYSLTSLVTRQPPARVTSRRVPRVALPVEGLEPGRREENATIIASLLIILGRRSLSHGRPGADAPRGCTALGGSGVQQQCRVGALVSPGSHKRGGCSRAHTATPAAPCPPLLRS